MNYLANKSVPTDLISVTEFIWIWRSNRGWTNRYIFHVSTGQTKMFVTVGPLESRLLICFVSTTTTVACSSVFHFRLTIRWAQSYTCRLLTLKEYTHIHTERIWCVCDCVVNRKLAHWTSGSCLNSFVSYWTNSGDCFADGYLGSERTTTRAHTTIVDVQCAT